jgi:NADH:ubiquinone oxidoreductase subunit 3 (subunit A)
MFCETCGQKLLDGAKFCGACGSKQSDGVVSSQPPVSPQATVAPTPEPVVESYVQPVPPPVQPPVPPVQPVRPVVQPVHQPVQRPAQPQPQYQAPPQQQYAAPPFQTAAILSVWDYLKMFLLLCIPLVNIVLMLLWAFNSSENPNKRNYALASLLFFVIMMVVGFVFSILLGGLFMAMFSQMGGYY